MNTSILLDIETLDTTPTSLITEIAAIAFRVPPLDPGRPLGTLPEPIVLDHLDLTPDFFEQLAAGRTFTADTISFHRCNGTLPTLDPRMQTPCIQVAVEIAAFFREHNPKHVWIQGTDFDRPVIEDFFAAVGQPLPWKYSKSRDARTAWDLAFSGQPHPKRPHKALEDCQQTIADLISALTELNRLHAI